MSDTVTEALEVARTAYERATEALRLAEAAARDAGVEVTPAVVDELTVKRINVVEDDGTVRVILGNSSIMRTLPVRGRLVDHPGRMRQGGLLFVNDEGTECGGLAMAGRKQGGVKEQVASLTFDDYEQNEGFRFGMSQEGSVVERYLEFSDIAAWSLADLIEELEGLDDDSARALQERYAAQGTRVSRLRLAKEADGSVRLVLRDARGQDRLRVIVPADGEPVIEILDADGVPRSLLPD